MPPTTLDDAQVFWWAWAGDAPFGWFGDEQTKVAVHGFAVCQYHPSGSWYRFTCDRDWQVVCDVDHETEDEAKADIPTNYDESRVVWHRFQECPEHSRDAS